MCLDGMTTVMRWGRVLAFGAALLGAAGVARGQLDDLSAGEDRFGATADFERAKVLGVVSKLMGHRDREVALKAITVIGSGNPYLSAERTVFWLAAIGSGKIEGILPMNPDLGNPGGAKYWEELVAVADGPGDDTVRVRAIRALGLVGCS
jgi:hypothetical protein